MAASRMQQISNILQVPFLFSSKARTKHARPIHGMGEAQSPAYVFDFLAQIPIGLSLTKSFHENFKEQPIAPSHCRIWSSRSRRRQRLDWPPIQYDVTGLSVEVIAHRLPVLTCRAAICKNHPRVKKAQARKAPETGGSFRGWAHEFSVYQRVGSEGHPDKVSDQISDCDSRCVHEKISERRQSRRQKSNTDRE